MDAFEKSLYVKPGSILGYALRPFSAFHASSLSLLDSPFLKESCGLGWGDLVTAILVCTSKREDGLDKVLLFQNSMAYRLYWRFKLLLCNISNEMQKMDSHIETYFDYPEVWAQEGGKRSGAPWYYYMVSLFWQRGVNSLDELWDMPLVELSCHKAILDELKGGAEIATGLIAERERNKNGS